MKTARIFLGLLTLALGACSASPDAAGGDLDSAGGKEDRGGSPAFREVDAAHSSASFRTYVGKALALLEKSDAKIARLTFAAIRDGRVKIDELSDLTCWDFERARQEIGVELESADYARLREPDSEVAQAVTGELDGYMWSNRIYVARGLSAKRLAATLVHEVNHVINRSEVGYWDDLPTSAFLHEYRAFHAERLFDPDRYAGVDLVDYVVDLYQLDGTKLPASVRKQPLTPRLLPDATAWRLRAVENDLADRDDDCPGLR